MNTPRRRLATSLDLTAVLIVIGAVITIDRVGLGRGRRAATSRDVDRGRAAGWERAGRMTDDDRYDDDEDEDDEEDDDRDDDEEEDDEDVLRC